MGAGPRACTGASVAMPVALVIQSARRPSGWAHVADEAGKLPKAIGCQQSLRSTGGARLPHDK